MKAYSVGGDARAVVGAARAVRLGPAFEALADAALASAVARAHDAHVAIARLVVALAILAGDSRRIVLKKVKQIHSVRRRRLGQKSWIEDNLRRRIGRICIDLGCCRWLWNRRRSSDVDLRKRKSEV